MASITLDLRLPPPASAYAGTQCAYPRKAEGRPDWVDLIGGYALKRSPVPALTWLNVQ